MLMKLSPKGTQFTEREEGVVLFVYDDAVAPTRRWRPGQPVHGHLTAGVGHLLSDAEIKLWSGKDIPKDQIDRWFNLDNDIAEEAVNRMVKVPLKQNQFDVLVDFVFNNNPAALASSSLLKALNKGQYDKVPAQLMRWDKTHINGKMVTSPGLQKRCADRAAYWNSEGSVPAPHPEDVVTGTQIGDVKPITTSPLEWAGLAVTGISGLSGFSGVGGFFGVALGIVLIGGFLLGAAFIVKRTFFTK